MPREYCHHVRNSNLTLYSERMYKTRFQKWGVKKYRVSDYVHEIDANFKMSRTPRIKLGSRWRETLVDRPKHPPGSEPGHFVDQPASSTIRRSSPGHLSALWSLEPIAPSSDDAQSPYTAVSSVDHTPDRSRRTSTSLSSGKASIRTPDSFESGEEQYSPSSALLGFNSAHADHGGNQNRLGNRNELEACPPRPRRPPFPLRSPSQYRKDVFGGDQTVADQIAEQGMGLLFPSTFRIPTPTATFQNLMRAPLPGSIFPLDEFKAKLHHMRISHQDRDLVSPSPETWAHLCFCINVLCGQQDLETAKYFMLEAALMYQRLVGQWDDQILSILNFILANLFLHRQARLAAEILTQAQIAASLYLDEEHPIQVSIKFMIFMALQTTQTCGITIAKLRQVVDKMQILCGGENHRYCVTSTYHLAWRIAMEPDMRPESLGILRQNQIRSEAVFGPGHMQTVALLTTQARVLGHLRRHAEAEQTMFEALRRIEEWDIKEDHPYLVEAKKRYMVFLRRRDCM
jgi:hypothetical protein